MKLLNFSIWTARFLQKKIISKSIKRKITRVSYKSWTFWSMVSKEKLEKKKGKNDNKEQVNNSVDAIAASTPITLPATALQNHTQCVSPWGVCPWFVFWHADWTIWNQMLITFLCFSALSQIRFKILPLFVWANYFAFPLKVRKSEKHILSHSKDLWTFRMSPAIFGQPSSFPGSPAPATGGCIAMVAKELLLIVQSHDVLPPMW